MQIVDEQKILDFINHVFENQMSKNQRDSYTIFSFLW